MNRPVRNSEPSLLSDQVTRRRIGGFLATIVAAGVVSAGFNGCDPNPGPDTCTITIQPGERASIIARGNTGLTEAIVSAHDAAYSSSTMYPGEVVPLGSTACRGLANLGRLVTPISEPSSSN